MPRKSTLKGTVSFRNAYHGCYWALFSSDLNDQLVKMQISAQKTMGTESSCRSGLTPSTEVTSFKAVKVSQAHVPRCPPLTAVQALSPLSERFQNALPLAEKSFLINRNSDGVLLLL